MHATGLLSSCFIAKTIQKIIAAVAGHRCSVKEEKHLQFTGHRSFVEEKKCEIRDKKYNTLLRPAGRNVDTGPPTKPPAHGGRGVYLMRDVSAHWTPGNNYCDKQNNFH